MNFISLRRLEGIAVALIVVLSLGACENHHGADVDFIGVVALGSTHIRTEVRDRRAIENIMACFDRRQPEINKFPAKYSMTIHYRDGRIADVSIGEGAAQDDHGRYSLPCDLAAMLREAIIRKK